tara:strand:+ start:62 stop:724 length:663 start_codon:yes stop_codon:yes gene_type:complete
MGIRRGEITTKIVSDGLVFNMDPANRACYPKTGTTTTDTIGNNVGTLSTTPLLSDSNFGVWELDGSDDNILLSSDITFPAAFSLSVWVNPDDVSDQNFLGDGSSSNNWIQIKSATQFKVKLKSTVTVFNESSGNNFAADEWQNIFITRDSSNNLTVYRNAIIFGSTTTNSVTDSTYSTIGNGTSSKYFDGEIGPIQTYNRALSAEEVLSNYNGLRGRFGV